MEQELCCALRAAFEAGREILKVYHSDYHVSYKEDNSPLTDADMNANKVILKHLEPTKIPIISEEGLMVHYEERRKWERLWMVDPLDGTKEFVSRNGEFTVNIALIQQSVPIMGIIYLPVLDVVYYALNGLGAYKCVSVSSVNSFSHIGDIIACSEHMPSEKKSDAYTVLTSRSHMNNETQEYLKSLEGKRERLEVMSKGSSLKFCLIAEGMADEYPRFGKTMEWDTAAGDAIVRIAGGRVVQPKNGEPLSYNKQDLSNPSFIVLR